MCYSKLEVKIVNIKKMLSEHNIKLVDFSKDLRISRPTLNSYIKFYEEGGEIPNVKYQQVFENLFPEEDLDVVEFNRRLEKYHRLLERDEYLGVKEFDIERTNLLASITKHIQKDLSQTGFDENIYIFINMLITSYREETLFKKFARYFLYLNDILDYELIEKEEEAFVSGCYRFMKLEKDNKLTKDNEYFELFIKRIEEIKQNNSRKSKEKTKEKEEILKKILREKLDEKVKEQLSLGVDINQINFDELLSNINLNEIIND